MGCQMRSNGYVCTITGPSAAGKSTMAHFLLEHGDETFRPKLVPKYTTRPQRLDDIVMADGNSLSFSRVASTYVVQHNGLPIIVATNLAKQLITLQGSLPGHLQKGLTALFTHLSTFERRLVIEFWNGHPVLESDGLPILEAVGCYRAYPGMEWEPR